MLHRPFVAILILGSACGSPQPPAVTPPASEPAPQSSAPTTSASHADDDLDGHVEHASIEGPNGLRVETAWHTQTGTMHVAQDLAVVAAHGTLHLVANAQGLAENVAALREQPLPLVDRVLAAGTSRWIVLGWSSYGGGMQSEHAWLVEDGEHGPVLVDSIVWTTSRRAAGLAIDSTDGPRIGIPVPAGDVDDSWGLQHGDRTLAVAELRKLAGAHDQPLTALSAYYAPPEGLAPAEHGWTGRFVWFEAGSHGFEVRP